MIKRAIDIVAGMVILLIGIIVLSPFCLWIYFVEKQWPIFIQSRVGQHNKSFRIYKLTTMRNNRVTTTGLFLRASRLDEIPQALNLLKGDMTFIGPRPETVELVRKYSQSISKYNERHRIKPGITGLAAITQGHTAPCIDSTKRKLAYDLYYVKHRSIWLDAFIVFKTVQTVLGLKGK